MRTSALLIALGLSGTPLAAQFVEPDLSVPFPGSVWTMDGTGTFAVENGKLVLTRPGTPGGPIRRPAALAIVRGESIARGTVSLQVRSPAPLDLPRRDVVIAFGYQSPTRFYYVHLAAITDAVHNGIFVVDGADRRRIDPGGSAPLLTDDRWHDVRIEWDADTGTIDVFMDWSKAPVLRATDTTIASGLVGLGSFDDAAEFRAIRVIGR